MPPDWRRVLPYPAVSRRTLEDHHALLVEELSPVAEVRLGLGVLVQGVGTCTAMSAAINAPAPAPALKSSSEATDFIHVHWSLSPVDGTALRPWRRSHHADNDNDAGDQEQRVVSSTAATAEHDDRRHGSAPPTSPVPPIRRAGRAPSPAAT
jgi:hypothetical protein